MRITRSGAQPSTRGSDAWFTGTVRPDAPFQGKAPARVGGATITLEPGARTGWHTHPLGQTLIVLSGLCRAQRQGGPVKEIRPGDIVWFAPAEKDRHGASPEAAMTRLAINEALDGRAVNWMEQVTDTEHHR